MSWLIRVGSTGFERGMNAGVTTSLNCSVTSTPCHTVAQWSVSPNTAGTTLDKAGSNPARQAEKVWRNVLATLVGV
jgi:hypothetical protein